MNTIQHPENKRISHGAQVMITTLKSLECDYPQPGGGWVNVVSNDLNRITGRAIYELETGGDDADCLFASAAIRIARRVIESEELRLIENKQMNIQELGQHDHLRI